MRKQEGLNRMKSEICLMGSNAGSDDSVLSLGCHKERAQLRKRTAGRAVIPVRKGLPSCDVFLT